jgi:hypothetical protein
MCTLPTHQERDEKEEWNATLEIACLLERDVEGKSKS